MRSLRLLSLHQKKDLASTSASLAKVYAHVLQISQLLGSLTVYFIYFSAHSGQYCGMKPSLVFGHSRGESKAGL